MLDELDIVHSDIKPENVLMAEFSASDRIKLIDFGSACFSRGQAFLYLQSRFYRSPEVLLGLPYVQCSVPAFVLPLPPVTAPTYDGSTGLTPLSTCGRWVASPSNSSTVSRSSLGGRSSTSCSASANCWGTRRIGCCWWLVTPGCTSTGRALRSGRSSPPSAAYRRRLHRRHRPLPVAPLPSSTCRRTRMVPARPPLRSRLSRMLLPQPPQW